MLETIVASSLAAIGLLQEGPQAAKLGELRVGHWVEVKGATQPDGSLLADVVKVTAPASQNEIIGTVRGVTEESGVYAVLDLDGQLVFVGAKCELRGVGIAELMDLEGARVEVEGYWRSPWKFSARELKIRKKGRDRLVGRIDLIDVGPESTRLGVLGREVYFGGASAVASEEPMDAWELAPKIEFQDYGPATREFDDDDDIEGRLIAPSLWAGARLEWRRTDQREFDLDNAQLENRVDNNYSLRGELRWAPSPRFFGLVEYRHAWRSRDDKKDGASFQTGGQLNEAHVYFRDVVLRGLDVQVGRQDFDEQREWLYDENLDAVRVILRRWGLRFESFFATVVAGGSFEDENTNTWATIISTDTSGDWSLGGYWIQREGGLDPDRSVSHLGLRALGEFWDRHESWAEVAFLKGQDANSDLVGFGFDIGTTWSPRRLKNWYFTVGLAHGSGDGDLTDGEDSTFRQTGLNDNNAKFGGVTSFRYYGELLDPELANLWIGTVGVGARFGERDSIDFVVHQYLQDVPLASLVDTELDQDPNGLSRNLGWEADLVFGSRSHDGIDVELVLGRFDPGSAFPGADLAWIVKVQVRMQL